MSDFNGVEDTLFVPLVGRIYGSKKYKDFFYDAKAMELEKYVPSSQISDNSNEYFMVASFARFYEFDNLVKEFINKNGNANIICLGCGLETMYFRINDERATFYEIDFPDVIRQRKLVLGETDHEILIGSNILETNWMSQIDKTRPTLVIACGVFQYLHYEEVTKLIEDLRKNFNNIELAFDATNKIGLAKSNEYVESTGNENAKMYFYVDKIKDFIKDTNTTLIDTVPFFQHSSKALKKSLKLSTKFTCFFGDRLGFSKIIYLKIN